MPIPTDELKDQIDHLADAVSRLADSQAALKDDLYAFRAAIKEDSHAFRAAIKEDFHAFQTAIKQDFHASQTATRKDFHGLRLEMTRVVGDLAKRQETFETKILTTLSIVKWVVSILGGVIVLSLINGIWWAGNLTAEVRIMSDDVRTLKADVGTLKVDVGALKVDIGALKGKIASPDNPPTVRPPTPRESEAPAKSASSDKAEDSATPAKSATGAEAQPMPFIPSGRKD